MARNYKMYQPVKFEELKDMNELNRFFEEVYKDAYHLKEMKVSQLSKQIANSWKGENYQFSNKGSERDKYNLIVNYISNACRTGGGTSQNFENDLNDAHNRVPIEVFVPLVVIDAAHRIATEFNKNENAMYQLLVDNVMPVLQEKLGISREVMEIISNNDRLSVTQALAEYANQHS